MTKTSHFRTCRWLWRNSLEGWANRELLIVGISAPFPEPRAMGACCSRWEFDGNGQPAHGDVV